MPTGIWRSDKINKSQRGLQFPMYALQYLREYHTTGGIAAKGLGELGAGFGRDMDGVKVALETYLRRKGTENWAHASTLRWIADCKYCVQYDMVCRSHQIEWLAHLDECVCDA